MTPRYLVRATERTKLSFIDMGKTMEGQVLEQDLEQNCRHVNYDLCIRNPIKISRNLYIQVWSLGERLRLKI